MAIANGRGFQFVQVVATNLRRSGCDILVDHNIEQTLMLVTGSFDERYVSILYNLGHISIGVGTGCHLLIWTDDHFFADKGERPWELTRATVWKEATDTDRQAMRTIDAACDGMISHLLHQSGKFDSFRTWLNATDDQETR